MAMEAKRIGIGSLCDELLTEILDRVPIKQVTRMKCLSKFWCSFISHYRSISKPRASSSAFFIQYGFQWKHRVLFLQAKQKQNEEFGIVMEKSLGYSIGYEDYPISFMGSSNGLLLFNQFVHPDKLIVYVCNPTAKQWQWETLPPLFHPMNLYQKDSIGMGLAYDGVYGHPFKVISYTQLRWNGDLEFTIYSSDTQEWRYFTHTILDSSPSQPQLSPIPRKIQTPHLFWRGKMLCIVKGGAQSFHADMSSEYLLVYEIQNNSFKLMSLPKKDENSPDTDLDGFPDTWHDGFLWESEGFIHYCQIHTEGFCVWKYFGNMEEGAQSDTENWKLVHSADIVTVIAQHPEVYGVIEVEYTDQTENWFKPCAFDEDLQILYILLPETIVCYDFETHMLTKIWTFEDSATLSVYTTVRSLSIQFNGTKYPIQTDSILSLPKAEPQGTPLPMTFRPA